MAKIAFVVAGHMYPDVVEAQRYLLISLLEGFVELGIEVHVIAYEGMAFRTRRWGILFGTA